VQENFAAAGLDALVAIGGEDTLGVAAKLYEEFAFPVVRRAKDDRQRPVRHGLHVGFDTRCRSPPRRSTAAHDGRVAQPRDGRRGHGAAHGLDRRDERIAGGADVILVPEDPETVEAACERLIRRHASGKSFSIVSSARLRADVRERRDPVVAADGPATDQFGHVRLGGVGHELAREIEQRTNFETRVTVLGHVHAEGRRRLMTACSQRGSA